MIDKVDYLGTTWCVYSCTAQLAFGSHHRFSFALAPYEGSSSPSSLDGSCLPSFLRWLSIEGGRPSASVAGMELGLLVLHRSLMSVDLM